MTIFFIVGLFLSFLPAHADIEDISRSLHGQRVEKEAEARPIDDEILRLKDEKTILESKLKQAEQAKEKVMQVVETKVSTETLDSILLSGKLGKCTIVKGKMEREYVITYRDDTMRVVFAPFDSLQTPMAHLSKTDDGFHAVEIIQKPFNPEKPQESGDMSATIRFAPEPLIPTFVIFRGQKINDQMFGHGSSYSPYAMTCVL